MTGSSDTEMRGGQHQTITAQQNELRRLKADLSRVTEERGILKQAAAYFASEYAFTKSRLNKYSVSAMCRVLDIERSGFYAWLRQPESRRAIEDNRLLGQIKQFWIESGFAYGYRNITQDMKDTGETCGKNRVQDPTERGVKPVQNGFFRSSTRVAAWRRYRKLARIKGVGS